MEAGGAPGPGEGPTSGGDAEADTGGGVALGEGVDGVNDTGVSGVGDGEGFTFGGGGREQCRHRRLLRGWFGFCFRLSGSVGWFADGVSLKP